MEHLTSWLMVRATKSSTADVVVSFTLEETTHPLVLPWVLLSDNAGVFAAAAVKDPMDSWGTRWKPASEYAAMLNGGAERMVGSINKVVVETVLNGLKRFQT